MMKLSTFLVLLLSLQAIAADAPRSIALSKKSDVSPADISKNLRKGCPNVSISDDATTSEYTLEAVKKTDPRDRGIDGNEPVVFFDLTLVDRDGRAVRYTSTPSLGGAVKDVCHAINTGVVVEVVDTRTQTQSEDVRGSGGALVPAVIAATTGRRTHTDTDTIYVIVNGEHAVLDCYERRTGCATIGPGKYFGELEGESLWVNYEMPLSHKALRNHYKVAGSW